MQLRPARRDDLSAVVAVMNAFDAATLGEPDTTEEDIASGWDESSFDLASDAVVAERDGEVIGYGEVYDRGEHGRLEVDVFVRPGLESEVAPEVLTAVMQRAYEKSGAATLLWTWVPVDHALGAIFSAEGFSPVREFRRMRASLEHQVPAAPDIEDVELRPVRRGNDEFAVHAVLADAFAAHVRPITDDFDRFVEQHVDHPEYDPDLWAIAWEAGSPIGAITVFDHGDVGFIRHVGVRRAARGRGIASALVTRAMTLLAERGQTRVDLGVDLDDEVGAARLYEKLGFTAIQRLQLVERPGEGG